MGGEFVGRSEGGHRVWGGFHRSGGDIVGFIDVGDRAADHFYDIRMHVTEIKDTTQPRPADDRGRSRGFLRSWVRALLPASLIDLAQESGKSAGGRIML